MMLGFNTKHEIIVSTSKQKMIDRIYYSNFDLPKIEGQSEIKRLLSNRSFHKMPPLTELYHLIFIGEL